MVSLHISRETIGFLIQQICNRRGAGAYAAEEGILAH
jgi:hypothetical protein